MTDNDIKAFLEILQIDRATHVAEKVVADYGIVPEQMRALGFTFDYSKSAWVRPENVYEAQTNQPVPKMSLDQDDEPAAGHPERVRGGQASRAR